MPNLWLLSPSYHHCKVLQRWRLWRTLSSTTCTRCGISNAPNTTSYTSASYIPASSTASDASTTNFFNTSTYTLWHDCCRASSCWSESLQHCISTSFQCSWACFLSRCTQQTWCISMDPSNGWRDGLNTLQWHLESLRSALWTKVHWGQVGIQGQERCTQQVSKVQSPPCCKGILPSGRAGLW